LNSIVIPNTDTQALAKKESRDAMKVEMDALEKSCTYEIVDKPRK